MQAYFDHPNEMFQELHSHVANCRRNAQHYLANPVGDEILRKIAQLMQNTADQQTSLLSSSSPLLANSARHSPIVLVGNEGTGKTTILAQVFSQSQNWFEPGWYFHNFGISRFAPMCIRDHWIPMAFRAAFWFPDFLVNSY